MKRISYSKQMREIAKRERRELVTVDVNGMTYQGPVSREEADMLLGKFNEWLEERRKSKETGR